MKIIADDKIPYLKGVLEPFTDIEYIHGHEINPVLLKDADALLIRTRTKCNKALLKGTKVKYIATATIGYDHIDTEYCKKAGILWTNAPGCNSSSVQQYIASALIALAKKNNFQLKDKALGVIGVGNVGKKVVKLAELLGMNVYLNDPPRERVEGPCQFRSLESIMRECDIISLHVPLSTTGIDKTFHFADENFFKKLNPSCYIINSARGEVIDTKALLKALDSKQIAGAVLDVWENEPNIDQLLLDKTDIGTPHIAGYSADGKANGTAMSVSALSRFFDWGIEDWYPDEIPEPENTTIAIECSGKDDQTIVHEAIRKTYDITLDNNRLRKSPDTFEKQRENYALRREFSAYKVLLTEDRTDAGKILRKLGFIL